MKKYAGHIDWMIFLPVIALMLFSLAFVYSASATFAEIKFGAADKLFREHLLRVLVGFAIIFVFSRVDYHIWRKLSKPMLFVSIMLLAAVLFTGMEAHGAARWIRLGPMSFQPTELAKFALVLHFAVLLSTKQDYIKDFKRGFLPFLIWTGVICGLIALQPNLSNMMVIFIIAFSMMFIGNTNLLHLAGTFLVGLVGAGIYAVSAPYRVNRLLAFMGMSSGSNNSAVENVSYQLTQALIAIGNGGIFGVGPGQNRQSHLFLPESYGDFIFSIIGEEYGFIGLSVIMGAFVLICWRGMLIAKKAPDNFGYFLAIGILITFAFYVFVNAGVNTGLLPTTGVPMPFVSYGGTAVFIYAGAIGILLNISAQAGVYPKITPKIKADKSVAQEANLDKNDVVINDTKNQVSEQPTTVNNQEINKASDSENSAFNEIKDGNGQES